MKKLKNFKSFILLSILLSLAAQAAVVDNLIPNNNTQKIITNLNAVQSAFDESSNTSNIINCRYSKKRICKIRIRSRMSSIIELPQNDKIKTWILGDSKNFSFEPIDELQQRAVLRSKIPGADTNLSIIGTSGFIYPFYIRADSSSSKYLPSFITRLTLNIADKLALQKLMKIKQDEINEEKAKNKLTKPIKLQRDKKPEDYLAKKPIINISNIFTDFKQVSGDKALMPTQIFDDGVWTYFKYGDNNMTAVQELPVIYKVQNGYDTPVNSRIEDGFLIIEGTSDKWTIRSGQSSACIEKVK